MNRCRRRMCVYDFKFRLITEMEQKNDLCEWKQTFYEHCWTNWKRKIKNITFCLCMTKLKKIERKIIHVKRNLSLNNKMWKIEFVFYLHRLMTFQFWEDYFEWKQPQNIQCDSLVTKGKITNAVVFIAKKSTDIQIKECLVLLSTRVCSIHSHSLSLLKSHIKV